jgi:glyoxylase-like metal-dependent hydrolase (beta-lactamase superfamily II)
MQDSKFLRWTVGDVTITRIVETPPIVAPAMMMFNEEKTDFLRPHDEWIAPFITDEGEMTIAWQCFVVETKNRRIMVDTCIGNDRKRFFAQFNDMNNPFLEDLAEAGYLPETIDTVLCTHLHYDHVGWNTHLVEGKWVPTFPNARYLFARTEWEYMTRLAEAGDSHAAHVPDSLIPVMEAGLVDLIEPNHVVCPEIRLIPTPGHTPGHVSVHIEAKGSVAVITGDVMHHPVQMAMPDKQYNFDDDKTLACCTRRAFLTQYQDSDALVIGTHFSSPTAGHVRSRQGLWWFDTSATRSK